MNQDRVAYLAARLRASVLAHSAVRRRGPKWRKLRIEATQQLAREARVELQLRRFIAAHYGAVLLSELSNDQLDETYRTVATW